MKETQRFSCLLLFYNLKNLGKKDGLGLLARSLTMKKNTTYNA